MPTKWPISFSLVFLCSIYISQIFAQDSHSLLQQKVSLPFDNISAKQALEYLQEKYDLVFTYNSSALTDEYFNKPRNFGGDYNLSKALELILDRYKIEINSSGHSRVSIYIGKPQLVPIYGYVLDISSGERINGAIISDELRNFTTYSDENGFFQLEIIPGNQYIIIKYLGYDSLHFRSTVYNDELLFIRLRSNNTTPLVLITGDHSDNEVIFTRGEKISFDNVSSFGSVIGVNDITNNIKFNPGVQSGNEGTGGIYVRGGSSDQNLILYDGMPLYEISHTAGISSIFINESINNVEFLKSGFPARYSGRLSSVIDVQLRNGNKNNTESTFSLSNYGSTLNINGPIIKDKWTYNFSGRASWIHVYLNFLLSDVLDYNNIDLKFRDFSFKSTYSFDNTHQLSLTSYYGADNLGLNDVTDTRQSYSYKFEEKNSLKWGTKLAALNYSGIINDKIKVKALSGILSYNYQNRNAYRFVKFGGEVSIDEIDVISKSNIVDYRFGTEVDYFHSNRLRFKFGSNLTFQQFNPTIRQSQVILSQQGVNQIGDGDSIIYSTSFNLFLENHFTINKDHSIISGMNWATSSVRGKTYHYPEPRFLLNSKVAESLWVKASYSRMHQFTHLLVNPGLGLPSNLWVPSTENIAPERADQLSLSFIYKPIDHWKFVIDGYYKKINGIVEYLLADGINPTILNGDNFVPIFNEDKDWENNVESGIGRVKGLEFSIKGQYDKLNIWFAYALSNSNRTFKSINEGRTFPYKYDRRHDINTGLQLQVTDKKTIGVNWVYGSGTAYTLAFEAFDAINGTTYVPSPRNSFRLPAFHHLDIYYEHTDRETDLPFSFKVGIYNVYNQLNPYYVILYQGDENDTPILKQVSIFPISPYIMFKTNL